MADAAAPHRSSPRRIASTPSWIALAPEAQAVDSEIGEPCVPKRVGEMVGDGAEQEAAVMLNELAAAAQLRRAAGRRN